MIDFDGIEADLIKPALEAAKLRGENAGETKVPGDIREDMISLILEADLVVCDVTTGNANVFYELGIRQALRKNPTVLILGTETAVSKGEVPFDISIDRFFKYNVDHPKAAVKELTKYIQSTLNSGKIDSPVFRALPTLPQVDATSVHLLPKDLTVEIERARSSRSAGCLRLLSQEVETHRFQWAALRAIGRAQWDIDDPEGALRTYKALILNDEENLDGNMALANLYEQRYRRTGLPQLLEESERAIKRVRVNYQATAEQRSEALSLIARNAKTQWRRHFEGLSEVTERRRKAVSRQLIEAYDTAWGAYSGDLKSCLDALQMCAIVNSLAEAEQASGGWANIFNSDKEAQNKIEEVKGAFEQLKGALILAIEIKRKETTAKSIERKLADLCNATLLFLTQKNDLRVSNAFYGCLPLTPGLIATTLVDLELFAKLGINTALAEKIIASLDEPSAAPPVVIVVGHRVDEPGRKKRFPESAVSAVKERLRETLTKLNQSPATIQVYASAAPGTDIVCHEVCQELKIRSTICLPMPPDEYSKITFVQSHLDEWRNRFLALTSTVDCLQLRDMPGLPKWLQNTGADEWERANRWVLEMAMSANSPKLTLVAVLDESNPSKARGGTAHMVQIARAAGKVDVNLIRLKDGEVEPACS